LKTLLTLIAIFAVTYCGFGQEVGGYTKTIQPITINQSPAQYEEILDNAYVDLIGNLMNHPQISYKRKVEAMTWKPEIKMMDGKETKGIIIFPEGTITVNKNSKVTVTLSEDFNEWSGNGFKVWDLFPFTDSPDPAYDLEILTEK